MAFNDKFRIGVHAVITNNNNEILQLKANYAERRWGLPGGSMDPGETIHETLKRECIEEIGHAVDIQALTGIYYHERIEAQVIIFRCALHKPKNPIILSNEHTEYKYTAISDLSQVQKQRVEDCLNFDGVVISRKF